MKVQIEDMYCKKFNEPLINDVRTFPDFFDPSLAAVTQKCCKNSHLNVDDTIA